ncbi:hypothetical protein HYH03_005624 [Edaphochlamys debaryana]|uniref:Fe2OG dioxygenase domain-containing protein n=1 Tax=Edaphochlamys debaryana TaxID=47281 RepID=A0A835Y4S4_9CHLO|nr:hypothetical protein HYH03_005624 [Edaphochlamys debaryana]|eukprot:KAG2496397.1 hypothetical protein HYH03_005624 [Edaphochlamys debaryana]
MLRHLGRLLALALALGATCVEGVDRDSAERLIGWQGETYQPRKSEEVERDAHPSLHSADESHRKGWLQMISWKPRAIVYHNFLSDMEARHILDLAKHQMKRSEVVGNGDNGVVDDIRTSYGTFLRRNADPVINAIEQRLALWSHIPASHQEDTQVLRYGPTNKYGPHLDGLERVASVLMYLVAPEEGGETAFVNSEWAHPDIAINAGASNFSKCAQGHVAYRPKRGDALLFFDTNVDYIGTDRHSEHTGCPVVKGIKWNAVKWIHGVPYKGDEYEEALKAPFTAMPDPGVCQNLHEMCEEWAKQGECEHNPEYMVGGVGRGGYGDCRLACKTCTVCAEGDMECYRQNRVTGGFLDVDESELEFH